MSLIAVAGAGGFIGGHLVASLIQDGHEVLGGDIKPIEEWCQVHPSCEYMDRLDLREIGNCVKFVEDCDQVYNLAADMGGMGFIETHKLDCMMSVLISTNLLRASHGLDIADFFYASSACVYPSHKQDNPSVTALKESDSYPADPEDGYGWEKLFSERLGMHYNEETNMKVRVARYHNVYGPNGTYDGGREKAPAALCRKVIAAKLSGKHEIDIWGDGEQTRSFMYIDDCIKGTRKIMDSHIDYPINLGSSELVSINELVSIIEHIAKVKLKRNYIPNAPQGVRGRNSDNTLIHKELSWEPDITLVSGLKETYDWIWNEIQNGVKR